VGSNWDELTGVAFLPYDGGTYQQAPYEEITQEMYERLVAEMPLIDWSQFMEVEENFTRQIECFADGCQI
jgi:ribonucleoside-diphosphate reductase alpha chain